MQVLDCETEFYSEIIAQTGRVNESRSKQDEKLNEMVYQNLSDCNVQVSLKGNVAYATNLRKAL